MLNGQKYDSFTDSGNTYILNKTPFLLFYFPLFFTAQITALTNFLFTGGRSPEWMGKIESEIGGILSPKLGGSSA